MSQSNITKADLEREESPKETIPQVFKPEEKNHPSYNMKLKKEEKQCKVNKEEFGPPKERTILKKIPLKKGQHLRDDCNCEFSHSKSEKKESSPSKQPVTISRLHPIVLNRFRKGSKNQHPTYYSFIHHPKRKWYQLISY